VSQTLTVDGRELTFDDIDRLARFGLRKMGSRGSFFMQMFAEDVLQEARIVVIRAAKTYDPKKGAFSTYVVGAMWTALQAIDRRYYKKEEISADINAEFDEVEGSRAIEALSQPPPEFAGPADEHLSIIRQGIRLTKGVPQARLKQIVQYRLEGRTYDDIGELMGVSRQRVHNQFVEFEHSVRKIFNAKGVL